MKEDEIEEEVVFEEVEVVEEVEEKEEEETPIFLQPEDEEEKEDDDPQTPAWFIKTKQKLKGKLKERDKELEELRAKIQSYEAGQPVELPKRPRAVDYDTDEEYEKALTDFETAKAKAIAESVTQSQQQEEKVRKWKEGLDRATDEHYDRATKLIQKHAIKPELYKEADERVKQTLETIYPDMGEQTFKTLVSIIGDGSEKTMYYIGTNKRALTEFESLLHKDKTGLQAAFYLGKETTRISGTTKKQSRAAKPAVSLKGDAVVSATVDSLKKLIAKAEKADDPQELLKARKRVKLAGYDPDTWSKK